MQQSCVWFKNQWDICFNKRNNEANSLLFVEEGLYVLWILFALGPGGLVSIRLQALHTEPDVWRYLETILKALKNFFLFNTFKVHSFSLTCLHENSVISCTSSLLRYHLVCCDSPCHSLAETVWWPKQKKIHCNKHSLLLTFYPIAQSLIHLYNLYSRNFPEPAEIC